jgi:peptidoglycan-associated lipoprotein
MITARSLGIVALGAFVPWAGLGGLGCSHGQKAPPAHPTGAPVAARTPPAARRAAQAAEPAQALSDDASKDRSPAIFFDFDSALLRNDAHQVLQKVAAAVGAEATGQIRIEGNCDELGTTEYNLALGEERARAAKTYLVHLGVPDGRVATVSYGSERPRYPGHDDDARAKNRRDDLVVR